MTEAPNKASTVTLKLPEDLKNRCMLLTFHTNLVRQYIANNNDLFPQREAKSFYDFGANADEEWLVDVHSTLMNKFQGLGISGPLDTGGRDMGTHVSVQRSRSSRQLPRAPGHVKNARPASQAIIASDT
jgi:hypothetical protein